MATNPKSTAATPDAALTLSERGQALRRTMLTGWKFRAFLWWKLPLAAVARLRIARLEPGACETTVKHGWRVQNPFGSLYFAVHAMAAEMSTGALVLVHTQDASISTLVTGMTATYGKATKARVTYRCEDGAKIAAAATKAVKTGEPVTVEVVTRGTCAGEPCAEFRFTWSMKKRSEKNTRTA